ncbi:MAG: class I SAM-dependent methyltransferase [Candidatus Woesearchaeota archaeon]|jgi:predicted O-methyltransferase YrrM
MIPFEDLIWLFNSDETTRGIIRMNLAEAALLFKYVKKTCNTENEKNIIEIGRKFGGSTAILASNLGPHDCVYSIDIKENDRAKSTLEKIGTVPNLHLITGDSKKIGETWKDPISLILIDGDHSYKGVKSDADIWLPHVIQFGYAFFHDVIGKKQELKPIIDNLLKNGWSEEAKADSLLCLQKNVN